MNLKEEINISFTNIFDLVLREEYNNLKNMGLKELTLNELHLLVKIDELQKTKNSVQPKDLMKDLSVTKGTLSTATTKLINKNYIEKEHDRVDGRKIKFKLKPKAKYAIELHDKWHNKFVEVALDGLNKEEQETIGIILKNILNNLDANKKD